MGYSGDVTSSRAAYTCIPSASSAKGVHGLPRGCSCNHSGACRVRLPRIISYILRAGPLPTILTSVNGRPKSRRNHSWGLRSTSLKEFRLCNPSVLRCWNPGAWSPLGTVPGRSDLPRRATFFEGPSAVACSLWLPREHAAMDSLPGKEHNSSLFTSVHGAQGPVAQLPGAPLPWATSAV